MKLFFPIQDERTTSDESTDSLRERSRSVVGRWAWAGQRSGVTLVELVVVIFVIVLLAGVVVPMMQPVLESREIREAARQLNAFMAKAQALAAQRGRPVGVMIEQTDGDGFLGSFQLSIAESPPPYAGDTRESTAEVNDVQADRNGDWTSARVDFTPRPLLLNRLVQRGDLIKLNHRGPFYRISSLEGDGLTIGPLPGSAVPVPRTGAGVPYQIYRRPQRSSTSSLSLPSPAVIDLTLSGTGDNHTYSLGDDDSLVIAFSPNGGVSAVYRLGGSQVDISEPLEPIFLFIGRIDRIDASENPNLGDGSNLWCAINHRTGQVTTSNNAEGAGSVSQGRRLARHSFDAGGG